MKEKELKELKSKLPFELSKDDKLMSIIFNSTDQRIHCSFICKNTLQFSELESILYRQKEYQDLKNLEIYFLVHGKKINRLETIEENGIKNGDIIIACFQDI